jgi:cytochrome oxidase Cu insertion factor (SCO1/SenC/PrrC family)
MRELAGKFGIHTYLRRDGALAPHAPFVYLLDPAGRLIYFFQDGLPPAEMARVLTTVLN